jgi:hypothetical protein
MVFRRFHRTAGPLVLLAFLGVIAAFLVPYPRPNPTRTLPFIGSSNIAGTQQAMFLGPNEDDLTSSRLFNMTSTDRQIAQLVVHDLSGQISTSIVNASFDYLPNGKRRLLVPLPARTTNFSLQYMHRIRRGRAYNLNGPGPPKVLFVLPFGRNSYYESGPIAVSETEDPNTPN